MKYLQNTFWMFFDQGIRVTSGIFVGVLVARHLGPKHFGVLSYVLAIFGILLSCTRLGMDSILVRELVNHPDEKKKYLGTAFWLMVIAGGSVFGITVIATFFMEKSHVTRMYIWIIMLGVVLQAFSVMEYNFQAELKAKFSAFSNSVALTLSAVLKICFVLLDCNLVYFVVAYSVDAALMAGALFFTHSVRKEPFFLSTFDIKLVRPLLQSVWPMVLAAGSTMLFIRADQLLIKKLLGPEQLGIYSAAARIYEGWISVSSVLIMSLFPAILRLKRVNEEIYLDRLSRIFSLVIWVNFLAALFVAGFSTAIIRLTYGPAYAAAGLPLSIIIFGGCFASMGTLTARYCNVELMEKKIPIRISVALVFNILLNLLLIPVFGISGSAIATVVCLIGVHYLLDFLDAQLKTLARVKNGAIFYPIKNIFRILFR